MDQICLVLPILSGKTSAARNFHRELDGPGNLSTTRQSVGSGRPMRNEGRHGWIVGYPRRCWDWA